MGHSYTNVSCLPAFRSVWTAEELTACLIEKSKVQSIIARNAFWTSDERSLTLVDHSSGGFIDEKDTLTSFGDRENHKLD